jgi:hypothetical protein
MASLPTESIFRLSERVLSVRAEEIDLSEIRKILKQKGVNLNKRE